MTRKNYNTRYTEAQVLDVKRHLEVANRRKDGGLASGERLRIAQATGVAVDSVNAINHGSSWGWLDTEEAAS